MSIRSGGGFLSRQQMKADQHFKMASLASQDGDTKDADRHMRLARAYQRGEIEEDTDLVEEVDLKNRLK